MPRRNDSFSRALADAQKRLEKAHVERTDAMSRILALDVEIPTLQITVSALRDQIDPVRKPQGKPWDWKGIVPMPVTPPTNMTPEELAKWYTERDLAGVSSIPPGGAKPAAPQLSEDELLPDDLPGKPVLEK